MLSIVEQPRSEYPRRDKARDSSRHVDDESAGVVERSLLGEVATTPEHEAVDAVDDGRPQRDEETPCTELDTAQHTSKEQQRRDRSEDELEVRQRVSREVER